MLTNAQILQMEKEKETKNKIDIQYAQYTGHS